MAFNPASRPKRLGRYETAVEVGKAPLGTLHAAVRDEEPRRALLRLIETGGLASDLLDRLSEAAWWSLDVRDAHLLAVRDVVLGEGQLGVAAEYVEGESLRALLRLSAFKKLPASLPVTLGILLDLAQGVRALEQQAEPLSGGRGFTLANGNLSADHVVIGVDGIARLTDPGVLSAARRIERFASTVELTQYSTPEQLKGELANSASDVFVLGVMFWELMSGGKHLFIGTAPSALAERITGRDVPRLDASGFGRVPKAVADVVARALSRDPSARFANVEEFMAVLGTLGERAAAAEIGKWVSALGASSFTMRAKQLERALAAPSAGATTTIAPRGAGARVTATAVTKSALAASPVAPRAAVVAPPAPAPLPIPAPLPVPPARVTPPAPAVSALTPAPATPEAVEELETESELDELLEPESELDVELEPESAPVSLPADELEPESAPMSLSEDELAPASDSLESPEPSEKPISSQPISSRGPGVDSFALNRLEPITASTQTPEPSRSIPEPHRSIPAPPLREPSSLPPRWLIVGAAALVVALLLGWLVTRSGASREHIAAAAPEANSAVDTVASAQVASAPATPEKAPAPSAQATTAAAPSAVPTTAAAPQKRAFAAAAPKTATNKAVVAKTTAKPTTTAKKATTTKTATTTKKTTTAKTAATAKKTTAKPTTTAKTATTAAKKTTTAKAATTTKKTTTKK